MSNDMPVAVVSLKMNSRTEWERVQYSNQNVFIGNALPQMQSLSCDFIRQRISIHLIYKYFFSMSFLHLLSPIAKACKE